MTTNTTGGAGAQSATLERAVALAEKGFEVFPLIPGGKLPARKGWKESASADALEVRKSWPTDRNYNVGVATGEIIVLDFDTYKSQYREPDWLRDLPDTYTTRTGRGGIQLWFQANGQPVPSSVEGLAPAVDVRGLGGLVVAPGSTVDGKTYAVVRDLPLAPLPDFVRQRLAAPRERSASAGAVLGDLDTPSALERAADYARSAPPAVQGQGGDNATFALCCRILDFGLSVGAALEALEPWNARCSPPWSAEELERKIENAARYRQEPIGRDSPTRGFEEIPDPPVIAGPTDADDLSGYTHFLDFTLDDLAKLPRQQWLIRGMLERRQASLFVAPGGSGKSLFTLQAAVALALGDGRRFGLDVREAAKTYLLSAEDDETIVRRRLGALCLHYGIDPVSLHGKLAIYNRHAAGLSRPFVAVEKDRSGRLVRTPDVARLAETLRRGGFGTLVVDPLVKVHRADENSNAEMDFVMGTLTDLAAETDAAVWVIHHTKKPPEGDADGFAGSADAGRGASAIKDAARIAKTFFAMSASAAKKLNVPEHARKRYVRLDDAKANHSEQSEAPDWFKIVSVALPNGDTAPALEVAKFSRGDEARAGKRRAFVMGAITEAFKRGNPIPAKKGAGGAKRIYDSQRLTGEFTQVEIEAELAALEAEGATLRERRQKKNRKKGETAEFFVPAGGGAEGSPTVAAPEGSEG